MSLIRGFTVLNNYSVSTTTFSVHSASKLFKSHACSDQVLLLACIVSFLADLKIPFLDYAPHAPGVEDRLLTGVKGQTPRCPCMA